MISVLMYFSPYARGEFQPADSAGTEHYNKAAPADNIPTYRRYLEAYNGVEPAASEVIADIRPAADTAASVSVTIMEGREAVVVEEGTDAGFRIYVPAEGLYQIEIEYMALEGRGSAVQTEWRIDGKLPFSEAEFILLYRMWRGKNVPGELRDKRDNDLMPHQEEVFGWQKVRLSDSTGVYAEPFAFYFTKGEHIISVSSLREPFALSGIRLVPPLKLPTADDVSAYYEKEGYVPADTGLIVYEAEAASLKSDTVLSPLEDKSSPFTTPYSTRAIRLNTIGGNDWNGQGQWIEWELYAPEDGLYRIAFRARQNLLSGSFVTRAVMVDGAYPSGEWKNISFNYKNAWQNVEIPYDIYLAKGAHTLRLTATPGVLSDIISVAEEAVDELNEAYRAIFMITGTYPDAYRDYMLEKNAPEIFPIFTRQRNALIACDEELLERVGRRGSMNGILQSFSAQLDLFLRKHEKIQLGLTNFKDNIAALSAWLTSIKQQSLQLDKIYLYPSDMPVEKLPKAQAGIWEQIRHEVRAFISSFFVDYNTIGDFAEEKETIEVWVQTGRDQANILKSLIAGNLQLSGDIGIELKLVPGQLMVATAAGRGPDVALQMGSADPINFACRGAAYNLASLPDFEQIRSRFRDSVWPAYELEGGVYALPETQTYQVMFYRTDILKKLNIAVPQTWDELFRVLGQLQKKNMTVGIEPQSVASMAMFLYQNGGELYIDGNSRSGLSSEAAQEAFERWMSLYTEYGVPTAYNSMSRFRTGEMPIVIEDFTLYNRLMIGAPEIRGMWDFSSVPATVTETGEYRRNTPGASTACMILKDTRHPEAAWEFLKWWTSAETQEQYGKELENLLGASARYPSANVEAFEKMPWSVKELSAINGNWDNVKGIPEVPGSYFLNRHISNAFRRVINRGGDVAEILEEYAIKIDEEIRVKRDELGLDSRGSE